ncbi:restriction endonuclease [Enterococcus sp. DIV0876]|uniref:restriction endonuclease n=1 Tax=Enterococcus sp. DIV0876 TaxID=2774633 RepID=UPI003D2FF518
MTETDFEDYTTYLLSKHQFEKVRQTKAYGDQGIDVSAKKDGVTYGIQCKRWKKNVGNKAIQEVYAGIGYYFTG